MLAGCHFGEGGRLKTGKSGFIIGPSSLKSMSTCAPRTSTSSEVTRVLLCTRSAGRAPCAPRVSAADRTTWSSSEMTRRLRCGAALPCFPRAQHCVECGSEGSDSHLTLAAAPINDGTRDSGSASRLLNHLHSRIRSLSQTARLNAFFFS